MLVPLSVVVISHLVRRCVPVCSKLGTVCVVTRPAYVVFVQDAMQGHQQLLQQVAHHGHDRQAGVAGDPPLRA